MRQLSVAFCCDVGLSVGLGHLMRSIALAEELHRRGARITFVCDAGSVPWAAEELRRRRFGMVAPPGSVEGHLATFEELGVSAVVFDSYTLPTDIYRTVNARFATLALVDYELRGAEADLLLDQNIGSEDDVLALPAGSRRLAGLCYVLVRDDVVKLRPPRPRSPEERIAPRVLGVFGGTDAFGAAPVIAQALIGTSRPWEATMITSAAGAEAIRAMTPAEGQSLRAIEPTNRLAAMLEHADLVVSAAGSSVWELAAMGVPAAVFWVADNQRTSYERLVESGIVAGLGSLDELGKRGIDGASGTLASLLADPARRSELSTAAWTQVDGGGRSRVADHLLDLIASRADQRLEAD